MESGKCLAGLPGGGGRGSTGGGPGQGLDLGTGREGGKWRGKAASSCWLCRRAGKREDKRRRGRGKHRRGKNGGCCGGEGRSETL